MAKDLTASSHDRQNILNNRYALQQAEQHLGLGGVIFEGETVFTKAQVVALYEVSESTIEKYLVSHADELKVNPYFVQQYNRAAHNYSQNKLFDIFTLLKVYDLKSKGVNNTSTNDGELLKELVYKILH